MQHLLGPEVVCPDSKISEVLDGEPNGSGEICKSPGAGPNRVFIDVGYGSWDRQQRPSQVRLDRLLDIDPAQVRREGAALDRAMFAKVLDAARPYLPELR